MEFLRNLKEKMELRKLERTSQRFLHEMSTLGVFESGRCRDYFLQLWMVRREGRVELGPEIDKAARMIAAASENRLHHRDLEQRIASVLANCLR